MSKVQFLVKAFEAHQLSAKDIQAWAALESRAAEPNAYLSPYHVLPAIKHLDAEAPPTIYMVERRSMGEPALVGVGVFSRGSISAAVPLPNFEAYASRYSLLSGLLLDRECTAESGFALLEYLRSQLPPCSCIRVPKAWSDGPAAWFAEVARADISTADTVQPVQQRAVLTPSRAGSDMVEQALGAKRKEFARLMRRLSERGEVAWHCHRGGPIPDATVEAFLSLEHAGWKGDESSSLRSKPADEAFFREMVAGFGSEGRAVFTELTLDGKPIASTSNFISGRAGFAFKIGWDPSFKAFSPGMLNEIEFILNAPVVFHDLDLFDSGASSNSFINRLWLQRKNVCEVTLPTDALGRLVVQSHSKVRSLKRRIAAGQDQFLMWQASRHDIFSVSTTELAEIAAFL